MRAILQNSAARNLLFLMVDSTDHITGKTGLTPTVLLSKNGGAFASPAGSVTEVGSGWYQLAANATDSNTLGSLIVSATAAGADPSDTEFEVVAYNPQTAWLGSLGATAPAGWINANAIAGDAITDAKIASNAFTAAKFATAALNGKGDWNVGKTGYSLTQAFPDNFASLGINPSGHISRVTLCDSNTDMRGTDNALLAASYTAPANSDIAAVKAVTDKLDTAMVLDGSVYQFTVNALELAPAGGGGGSTDWTADERTAIRAILGIPSSGTTPADPSVGILDTIRDGLGGGGTDWTADERTAIRTILGIPGSGTTPADPSAGILDTIRDAVGGVPAAVWGHSTRALSEFAFSVTVGTNNDKNGYSLAADQAVNVTKVGGNAVTGPNDFKADLSGIPAAVWGHGSRSLTSSVTVGGYDSGQSPAALVDLSGVPAAVWGHSVRTLSAFGFSVTVGGYESGMSPAAQLDVSSLAAKTDLPSNFSLMVVNSAGQVSASNVAVTVNPTVLDSGSVTAIQAPILAAISTISPAAADYAIKLDIKYQGNGVPNCKVALVGSTVAAVTDSNGLAQLNVNSGQYLVRVTPPDGYQFVADLAVEVLTADVTVPVILAANALPSVVPPLSVTYDEIRRHVGRFLGFGSSPDQFEDSQARAVEDTIRQGLRDVYFPSINGAPYEWSFLKQRIELQLSGGSAFALPSNFVRLASQVTVAGLGYPLRQVSESALRSMAIDSTEEGRPIYFALAVDGDALQLGVTLYRMLLFPTPPANSGYVEFWYHTSPELDFDQGGPLGGSFLATTIIESCLARAEIAQNIESISQGGGIHIARAQDMLRRAIEADRSLQAETLQVSMADQMRPQQQV